MRTVEESGLVYMLGETSYYYPAVLYCRRRYAAGHFGAIVYGEAGLLSSSSLQPLAIPVTARLGTSFPFLRAW